MGFSTVATKIYEAEATFAKVIRIDEVEPVAHADLKAWLVAEREKGATVVKIAELKERLGR